MIFETENFNHLKPSNTSIQLWDFPAIFDETTGYLPIIIIIIIIKSLLVEPPFGLKRLVAFWCRRGGVGARLVRGKGK